MAVSDRIAVMKDGLIQQLGTPRELYHRPTNEFVSSFIGRTNLLEGTLTAEADNARLDVAGASFQVPGAPVAVDAIPVKVSVRPEQFELDPRATEGIPATVLHGMFLGMNVHYVLELADGTHVEAVQESEYDEGLAEGTKVFLNIKRHRVNIFTANGERNIREAAGDDVATTVGAAS